MLRRLQELMQDIPADDEETALEQLARRIVDSGMTTAAILFLESSRPMSGIAGQAAIVATPLIGGFIEPMKLEKYAALFSNRRFIERLIDRIEALEAEREGQRTRKNE